MSDLYDGQFYEDDASHLRFNSDYIGPIDLPADVVDCSSMFAGCILQEGCYLRNFDTSHVTAMNEMFAGSKLSKSFTLGSNFTVKRARQFTSMFDNCQLTNGQEYVSNNKGLMKSFDDIKGTLNIIDMLSK